MSEISKIPLYEYADKSDKPIELTNEGDKSGRGSISFINGRKHTGGNAYLGCVLVWCQGNHFYFEEDGVRTEAQTWSEILHKGKAYFFDKIDGPGAAISRINATIELKVSIVKHQMDIRVAEFRSMLFTQTQSLKEVTNG